MYSQIIFLLEGFETNIALMWCIVWMSCHDPWNITSSTNNNNSDQLKLSYTLHFCWRKYLNSEIDLVLIDIKNDDVLISRCHPKHMKSYLNLCASISRKIKDKINKSVSNEELRINCGQAIFQILNNSSFKRVTYGSIIIKTWKHYPV